MKKFGSNFVKKVGTSDGAHLKDVKLIGLYQGRNIADQLKNLITFQQIFIMK